MKRLLCLLFALLLCTGCAGAEQAFPLLDAPLEGALSNDYSAYELIWSLPQLLEADEAASAINQFYAEFENSLKAGDFLLADEWDELDEGFHAELSYAMTDADEHYVCFALTLLSTAGNGENAVLWADTFALDGLYAGQKVGLSQLLGLEEDNADENSPTLAAQLASKLVWQIISQESQNPDGDYLDGLTEEQVQNAFIPEQDFYLDADGNVVFFIQSGEIAGEIAGILEYPFSVAELLSAVK